MDSDMGNTESSYFNTAEPIEQKLERQAEKSMVQGGKALLEEIIKRFTEKVAFYGSLDSIQADVEVTPEEHQKIVLANQIVKVNLTAELEYLKALKEQYL